MSQTTFHVKKAMCYLTLVFSLCAITGHVSAVDKVDTVNQQKIVATGTVLDETGEPMPGVSIDDGNRCCDSKRHNN